MLAQRTFLVLAFLSAAVGCATTDPAAEPRYNIIKPPETAKAQEGGIPPERQNEIKLVLQQRDASTRACYQRVLNEKNDRAFAGTVQVIITVGTNSQASDVRVAGGTLHNPEVESCLVETIKVFEFPKLDAGGEIQYEFLFRPAY
jgi:hypothetical protein